MSQSEELTTFYKAYLAWVEAGTPLDLTMRGTDGLCGNLMRFCDAHYGFDKITMRTLDEMNIQFETAGLNHRYPFDDGEYRIYRRFAETGALHLNPKRIQWVREHAT